MHRFDGYDIELTRGDSLTFRVVLSGRTLAQGAEGLFTVRRSPRDDTVLIEKKGEIADGVLEIALWPQETDLPPRTYCWDVRVRIPLETGGYEQETPMEYAAFTILDVVGRNFGADDVKEEG